MTRLDQALVSRGLTRSRSQAENLIKLGQVMVDGKLVLKPGWQVEDDAQIVLAEAERYVSRAGMKLASVARELGLDFRAKVVLDVGSSTGGFTDYALKHGAKKVIGVDVGSNQLHPELKNDERIKLHEQTDIRDFSSPVRPDIIIIDVSFISLRLIMPSVSNLAGPDTLIVAMVKPQFEAGQSKLKHKGVIKNESMRRTILRDFEVWARDFFVILNKADSKVAGTKGNLERFYLLRKLARSKSI